MFLETFCHPIFVLLVFLDLFHGIFLSMLMFSSQNHSIYLILSLCHLAHLLSCASPILNRFCILKSSLQQLRDLIVHIKYHFTITISFMGTSYSFIFSSSLQLLSQYITLRIYPIHMTAHVIFLDFNLMTVCFPSPAIYFISVSISMKHNVELLSMYLEDDPFHILGFLV